MQKKQQTSALLQNNLVTAMAFSHSGEYCAVGLKKQIKLLIFRVKDITNIDSWELLQERREQSQPISDIDWSKDDKIISGSHDRSVFIYKKTGNSTWQKMLVNIDIKLSILCSKWAPNSKKFGVSASCRTLGIGFYNVEASCWTTSYRQRIVKSPIVSISFHPSSNVIAAGSLDNSVKLISCSFKNSENKFTKKSQVEDKNYQGPFQNVQSLFEILVDIDNVGNWVNHVSFQLNGSYLLVLPHGSDVKLFDVIDEGKSAKVKQTNIKWSGLPFLSGYISDKGVLYAGGFDKKVAVFNRSSNGFSFGQYLEHNEKSSSTRSSKGIVSAMLSGLQKKGNTITNQGLQPWQHANSIKILSSPNRKYVVSYDINGIIHFWQ